MTRRHRFLYVLLIGIAVSVGSCNEPPPMLVHFDAATGTINSGCVPGNMDVEVEDDFQNDVLTLTRNDEIVSLTASEVTQINVELCGAANAFSYQVAAPNTSLDLPRSFRIVGHEGFDQIAFEFDSNSAGQYLSLGVAPCVELDLGGGQDQVEIRTYQVGGGVLQIDADLGPGNDDFDYTNYPTGFDGSLMLNVEGGPGDDHVAAMFNGGTVPAARSVTINLAGDTLDFGNVNPYDNVADHGADVMRLTWQARVDGSLSARVRGDDALQRFIDLGCGQSILSDSTCVFRSSSTRGPECTSFAPPPPDFSPSDTPCDLEAALLQPDSLYAADDVQTLLRVVPQSSGSIDMLVDGGLASDEVVLLVDGVDHIAGLASADLTVTGGQQPRYKYDLCFAGDPDASVGAWVAVENCDEIDPDIIDDALQ